MKNVQERDHTTSRARSSRDATGDEATDVASLSDVERSPDALGAEQQPRFKVTVNPVALVITECITITSAMRKHARWSQSSVSAILGGGPGQIPTASARVGSRSNTPTNANLPQLHDPLKATIDDNGDESLASRWGLRSRGARTVPDNPLLSAFSRLRRDLSGCTDLSAIDAPSLLHPFLQVIRSSSTSASITSLAVISITKFLSYNLLTLQSPRIALAMHWLAAAITHCRFEASDSAADEVVLLRILKLMELIISRPEGQLLSDERVCEMMSTGLSMCCQARLSEVLRRSAEMVMVTMSQVLFTRLKSLEVEPACSTRSRSNTLSKMQSNDEAKVEPQVNGHWLGSEKPSKPTEDQNPDNSSRASLELTTTAKQPQPGADGVGDINVDFEDITPYSLQSIKELFRVLIELLDPHNRQHTNTMRIMALRIIDVALEVAGPAITQHPVLTQLVQDDLCRHLFQLVRSDDMVLLNSSLRVAGLLLSTCRHILKLQQELYLSYLVACLHPRVDIPQEPGINPALYEGVPQAPKLVKPAPSQPSSGRSTPVPVRDRRQLGLEGGSRRPEAREAMVEAIGTLVRIPSFMAELYVNYDCEVDRQDLCEDMIGLLSRNAFPDSATWSTTNVPPLCLDSLLSFVQFMAERLNDKPVSSVSPTILRLREQRRRKKIIKSGAAKFNDDPKGGVAYLVRQGIIVNPDDPLQIAQFLKSTSHVSKTVLGEFITKRSNATLLEAFIGLSTFDGKRIDEALRDLLGSFRLPGESALIERIVNVFTEKYMSSSVPPGIANKDAAFVLTYAIIMLNTDLYNPNVKAQKRMTYEDFARNLRGVNDGQDFASDYLQDIYDAIKQNEIILPAEHDNKHAFEYAWKELLTKSQTAGHLTLCESNEFDAEMFRATWKPIVATLCYVFMSASDDAVYSRVVVGFDQCAQIAAKYGVTDAFDRIVHSLAILTTLASETTPNTALNTEVQVDKRTIMVSELAVKFGREFRAQLATAVLFRILVGQEYAVGHSWTYIVRMLRNLFVNSLIQLPSFEGSRLTELPPIPLQQPSQVIDRDSRLGESGLFSTLSSYLSSYAADDPPEPSEEEVEHTLSTLDCVKACQPNTVLSHLYTLPVKQISDLVTAILSQLPEDSSPIVAVKPDRPAPVASRLNGHKMSKIGLSYNPNIVFLYELATILTLRNEETLGIAGDALATSLQTTVRDASNLHPLTASRIVHYLLDLLRLGFAHDFMRAPVVLHAISSFEDSVLDNTAPTVITGLSRCITYSGPLRNEILNSPDFWSILQRLHQHKGESNHVVDMLQVIVNAQPSAVTADNYEATIALANDFCAAGSIGTIQEQRKDFAAKRGKQIKEDKSEASATVARGVKAISIIYQLTGRIPSLIDQSHLERNEAWAAYWSPIFRALSTQCVNPCREIRHKAMAALQRSLLSEHLASDDHTEWTAIFGEVLFPLTLKLLKPEIYQLDQVGMAETRLQAATLLCKIFLRYLDYLADCSQMLELWTKILELLDRMMNSGSQDVLGEAVPENLKNILLVMAGSGYLSPPQKKGDKGDQVWMETEKRLSRFLPGLLQELFPPERNQGETTPTEAAAAESPAKQEAQPVQS